MTKNKNKNKIKIELRNDLVIEVGMSISVLSFDNTSKPIRNVIVTNIKNNNETNDTIIETISLFGGAKEYTIKELSEIAYKNEMEAREHLSKEISA